MTASNGKTAIVELHGAKLIVAIEYWSSVRKLAPVLFGLTCGDETNKRRQAEWALRRAAQLVPELSREARNV